MIAQADSDLGIRAGNHHIHIRVKLSVFFPAAVIQYVDQRRKHALKHIIHFIRADVAVCVFFPGVHFILKKSVDLRR